MDIRLSVGDAISLAWHIHMVQREIEGPIHAEALKALIAGLGEEWWRAYHYAMDNGQHDRACQLRAERTV